jgi:hypothetical protein
MRDEQVYNRAQWNKQGDKKSRKFEPTSEVRSKFLEVEAMRFEAYIVRPYGRLGVNHSGTASRMHASLEIRNTMRHQRGYNKAENIYPALESCLASIYSANWMSSSARSSGIDKPLGRSCISRTP